MATQVLVTNVCDTCGRVIAGHGVTVPPGQPYAFSGLGQPSQCSTACEQAAKGEQEPAAGVGFV